MFRCVNVGLNVPELHASMPFSTRSWSCDQHSLPIIHYLHHGADVIWSAVFISGRLSDTVPGGRVPPGFFIGVGGKTEGLKAEIGGEVLGEGAATPSPPARGCGERCEFRSGVRSRAGADDVRQSPDRPKVFHYFQHSGWPLPTL